MTRHDRAAGAVLALAAAMKVLPAIFVLYFVCTRRWRALGGFALGLLLGLVLIPAVFLGPAKLTREYRIWLSLVAEPVVSRGTLEPAVSRNQSIAAVVYRAITTAVPHQPTAPVVARFAALLMSVALVLASIVVVESRSAATEDAASVAAEMGVFVIAMLLTAPTAWAHYYIVLLLPIAMITDIALRSTDDRLARLARSTLATVACLQLRRFGVPRPAYIWRAYGERHGCLGFSRILVMPAAAGLRLHVVRLRACLLIASFLRDSSCTG